MSILLITRSLESAETDLSHLYSKMTTPGYGNGNDKSDNDDDDDDDDDDDNGNANGKWQLATV